MSIIIRPSQGVFQRTMPLVVVFGAWRSVDGDTPLDAADHDTITRCVSVARRLQMPLAFSRAMKPERDRRAGGVWLPECRPRVTDRVFDHPRGSCFENRDFEHVFRSITQRDIYLVGPRFDSSLRATLRDTRGHERPVKVVIAAHPLQNCSTAPEFRAAIFRATAVSDADRDICVEDWERSFCSVEHLMAQ
ncbi:isochorismatase family protein [Halovulum dunhuangense]|uniref:Isochorismatase family protein n=1 Tax=Halovulum dunhuangense TaxID=1505036 RepID=A0A849L5A4_9RHOB|nr:isochorismatase family protein [Halovulum dunhuangense]NNU81443.1 isochorismatase family protein [Halovulum dunhuangense]